MQMRENDQKVYTFDLDYVERKDIKGYKSFELASTISQDSVVRGSTTATAYSLKPIMWLKKSMEAAKEEMVFQPIVRQEALPEGQSQLTIPLKTIYMASGDWEASSAEYTTADTDMLYTDITTNNGVFFEPSDESYGCAFTNKALRTNALNLIQDAEDELQYRMSVVIDTAIRTAITPASGGITEMSNTARGVQTIFGGDATNAANSLDAGDVMTPALIKKAKRLLMSDSGYYWLTNAFTKSAVKKNPFRPGTNGQLYGLISVEAEEALLNASQFTNAAEYGKDSVIQTGNLGKYTGINMVSSNLVRGIDSGSNLYVQGANAAQDVNVHENLFVKANYCGGLVWGQKPKMTVYDIPARRQKGVNIEMAYQAKALYPDAIVRAVTADE